MQQTIPDAPRSTPLVTVALPVFNGGADLRVAVQSIILQSLRDWELLLIDDGSTDGALRDIERLGDARIRIVRDGQNKGIAARLNQAVGMARGEYFARMDHDDIAHPERFARQVAFLEATPSVDLLGTRCIAIDAHCRLIGVLPSDLEHERLCARPWRGVHLAHPSWLGRTRWFRQNPYSEPAPYRSEDQELLLRAHRTSRYHTLPQYLMAYRIAAPAPWQKLWRTRLALCVRQIQYFKSHRQWADVALALAYTGLRVIRDSAGSLGILRPKTPSRSRLDVVPAQELQAWREILAARGLGDASGRRTTPWSFTSATHRA